MLTAYSNYVVLAAYKLTVVHVVLAVYSSLCAAGLYCRVYLQVEYDLENSSKDDLRVLTSDRIEQSAVPLCMAWYPPVTKESFMVTANDQFKFKLYNATTKMCRHTFLGPTFGSPIQK